ncbi:hypothetical protein [Oceanobacillus arenosus]|nr:hypothetical protein [Oceanobacillus arenosus]
MMHMDIAVYKIIANERMKKVKAETYGKQTWINELENEYAFEHTCTKREVWFNSKEDGNFVDSKELNNR